LQNIKQTKGMGKYKISDLENLSGVKSHTIRIWEQRYNLLTPKRTATNIRYYDDEQLKKLLNIVTLQNAGYKISAIGNLSDNEIANHIEQLNTFGSPGIKEETLINQLISSGLSFNEYQFEKAFSNAVLSFGVIATYKKVIYPMLNKIGLLWVTEEFNPAQEHFISNLIRQKLFSAIDSIEPVSDTSKSWLLFLPENEYHEMGLLMANFILRSYGKSVCYLGANVPIESLIESVKQVNPGYLLMFNVKPNQTKFLQILLDEIAEEIPDKTLYVGCSEIDKKNVTAHKNQEMISSFNDFIKLFQ